MFKNLIIYRLVSEWPQYTADMEQALDATRYVKCNELQEKSMGWVEPRGIENGPLVEVVGGQILLKFMIETKAVPASAVADKLETHIKELEQTTGRKPGKKECREIKDDIRTALLPMAFSKKAAVLVWVDPKARLLVLETGSQTRADDAVTGLLKVIDGLLVIPMMTDLDPAKVMAHWLVTREAPNGFTVDRECELKAPDETKAVVRYTRHSLDTDEVSHHITSGKMPTKVGMTWDDRVSFVLTDSLQLKKVSFLEVAMTDAGVTKGHKDDAFDADVALATGELSRLMPDLFDALGSVIAASEDQNEGEPQGLPMAEVAA